jgi:hypothetical protein
VILAKSVWQTAIGRRWPGQELAFPARSAENVSRIIYRQTMQKKAKPRAQRTASVSDVAPFAANVIVLVTLNAPREKFWGAILNLAPAGVSVRGIDLNSMEDFIRQVKAGDIVTPNAVFFPMHRIERIELDLRNGDIPSLEERFEAKTGFAFSDLLREFSAPGSREPAR